MEFSDADLLWFMTWRVLRFCVIRNRACLTSQSTLWTLSNRQARIESILAAPFRRPQGRENLPTLSRLHLHAPQGATG